MKKFAIIVVYASLILGDGMVTLGDDDSQRAACVAYQANLESLRHFKCVYVLTKAYSNNIQDALSGRYDGIRSCEFLYVVSGGMQKLQTVSQAVNISPKKRFGESSGAGAGKSASQVDFLPMADLRLVFRTFWEEEVEWRGLGFRDRVLALKP